MNSVVSELFDQFDPLLNRVFQFQLNSLFSQLTPLVSTESIDEHDGDDHDDEHGQELDYSSESIWSDDENEQEEEQISVIANAQQTLLELLCLPLLALGDPMQYNNNNIDENGDDRSKRFIAILQQSFFQFFEMPVAAGGRIESDVASLERLVSGIVMPILQYDDDDDDEEEENRERSFTMEELVSQVMLGRVDWVDEDHGDDHDSDEDDVMKKKKKKAKVSSMQFRERLRDMKHKVNLHLVEHVIPQAQCMLLEHTAQMLPSLHIRTRKWALRAIFYPETKSTVQKKRQIAERTLDRFRKDLDPFFHLEPLVLLTKKKKQKKQTSHTEHQRISHGDALYRVLDMMLGYCVHLLTRSRKQSTNGGQEPKVVRILRRCHVALIKGDIRSIVRDAKSNVAGGKRPHAPDEAIPLMLSSVQAIRLATHLEHLMAHVSIKLPLHRERESLVKCGQLLLKCLSLVFSFIQEPIHRMRILEQSVISLATSACSIEQRPYPLILQIQRFISKDIVGARIHDDLFTKTAQFRAVVIEGIVRPCIIDILTRHIPGQMLMTVDYDYLKRAISHVTDSYLLWTRACIRLIDRVIEVDSRQQRDVALFLHSAQSTESRHAIRATRIRRNMCAQLNSLFRQLALALYLLHRSSGQVTLFANVHVNDDSHNNKIVSFFEEQCTVCRAALLSIVLHNNSAIIAPSRKMLSVSNVQLLTSLVGTSQPRSIF